MADIELDNLIIRDFTKVGEEAFLQAVANGEIGEYDVSYTPYEEPAKPDLSNTTDNVDFVVEKQEPDATNNYTWYFKFKSGWVIMGGYTNSVTSTGQIHCSATTPVPVKTLPTLIATPVYQSGGSVVVVTSYRSENTIYVTLEKNTSGSTSTTAQARWLAVGIAE